MTLEHTNNNIWQWKNLNVSWKKSNEESNSSIAIILIHGFGACKEHWRYNQDILGQFATCYSIDLIGFGNSSQPIASNLEDRIDSDNFSYNFDNWSYQIKDFIKYIVKKPVILIGNSIGGVIALQTAKILKGDCKNVVLINCALRKMDDKRINEKSQIMKFLRPYLKLIVKKRWLSKILFKNSAKKSFIAKVLKTAYPSLNNIDSDLINMLYNPTQRKGAAEAFYGFINIFDDYLAPNIMKDMKIPVDLIWGENDPWEPVEEAYEWLNSIKCIRSLNTIKNSGHCPHDETPEQVNPILVNLIQQAI